MDDLFSPIQVIHKVQAEVFLVIGPDEGPGLLVDKVAGGTRTRVDFDEPEALVAAVHFLVGDAAAVFGPTQARNAEIDWLHGGFDLPRPLDVKEIQLVGRELVSRQVVGTAVQLGPAAVAWRRLDQKDFLVIARLNTKGRQRFAVGRPVRQLIGLACFAIRA